MPQQSATSTTDAPTLPWQLANFAVFQAAWFGAVLGAAHHVPWLGASGIGIAVVFHLWRAKQPMGEARLVMAALLIGFMFELLLVRLDVLRFTSGQPYPALPAYWMVLMWGLLSTTLNVTLRWLKPIKLYAAVIGAIAGPASYAAGARLGALTFNDQPRALTILAGSWAVLLPLLVHLSNRYDGVGADA